MSSAAGACGRLKRGWQRLLGIGCRRWPLGRSSCRRIHCLRLLIVCRWQTLRCRGWLRQWRRRRCFCWRLRGADNLHRFDA
jgi:hypothetical protein